ncbi:hypothetical protein CPB84DRAFT_1070042 [Gymnopilus junonius]|uniref:Uncharacterized protein n=1 Tax=Gymnopilus junonius TaxID=109634 RepID=A0A9P5TU71_GYMJU|nr:hypothetical protein CPB84DRAFT_1070042 [Gymnopilus junonius]
MQPYLPDFWESSSASRLSQPEEHQPKLIVVAGAGTHHGGGPSHNLLDLGEEPPLSTDKPAPARSDSLLDDILEDLQFPPAKNLKNGFGKFLKGT